MNYNLGKIRERTAYYAKEISILFNIDTKTVYRWIKAGLPLLDNVKSPKLIMGYDLKAFLQAKRPSITLKQEEFFCLRCRKAVLAKVMSNHIGSTGKTIGIFNREQKITYALCGDCGGKISKFF